MGIRLLAALVLSLSLLSCGKEMVESGNVVSAGGTDGNENTSASEIDCTISNLEDALPSNCKSIKMGTTLLAGGSWENSGEWKFTASRRSGGAGGTKWFNLVFKFAAPQSLILPTNIEANGRAGNGQKLYIRLSSNLDCAWYSHANNVYTGRRCYSGATREPAAPSGFLGGTEVFVASVSGVSTIEMTVNGSSGNGILTVATALFRTN